MTDALGASVSHITLVGSNQNASPVWTEETGKDGQPHAWSPYGHGNTDHFSLGFNGERIDPISRTYHLGNGYRAYNPTLMRFNCPDSLSPFGPGGINPYAYCAGDPINHADPSGHISVGAGIGVGLGVVGILGGAFALFTGGASIGVAGAIAAAIGFAADGTGIASAATEESDPQASATLGWVSLGLGIASGVVGAAPAIARGVNKATAGLRGCLENIHKTGLSGRGAPAAGRAWANSAADTSEFLRVDIAPPSIISRTGFVGNNTPRIVKLYGNDTIFAAKSIKGIAAFKAEVSSGKNLFGSARKYYFNNFMSNGYSVERPKPLNLYKITLQNSHPFQELTTFLNNERNLKKALSASYDLNEYTINSIQLSGYIRDVSLYSESFISTQEIQIKGPIHPDAITYIHPSEEVFIM